MAHLRLVRGATMLSDYARYFGVGLADTARNCGATAVQSRMWLSNLSRSQPLLIRLTLAATMK